jgi:hypothetical protein
VALRPPRAPEWAVPRCMPCWSRPRGARSLLP